MPHCPFWHVAAPFAGAVQATPQAPQSATVDWTLMHALPQRVKPALQVNPHVPAVQVGTAFAGALHTLPHAPQFDVSVARVAHEPLQFVVPWGQEVVQAPAAHTLLTPQALPQAPQFALSDCSATHAPLQAV